MATDARASAEGKAALGVVEAPGEAAADGADGAPMRAQAEEARADADGAPAQEAAEAPAAGGGGEATPAAEPRQGAGAADVPGDDAGATDGAPAASTSSSVLRTITDGASSVLEGTSLLLPHLGGAIDIIAVRQPDGSIKSSPFYVRFGKYTALLRRREKRVHIRVNDAPVPMTMHVGRNGEAYFLLDEDGRVPPPPAEDAAKDNAEGAAIDAALDDGDSLLRPVRRSTSDGAAVLRRHRAAHMPPHPGRQRFRHLDDEDVFSPPSGYSSGDDPVPQATVATVAAVIQEAEVLREAQELEDATSFAMDEHDYDVEEMSPYSQSPPPEPPAAFASPASPVNSGIIAAFDVVSHRVDPSTEDVHGAFDRVTDRLVQASNLVHAGAVAGDDGDDDDYEDHQASTTNADARAASALEPKTTSAPAPAPAPAPLPLEVPARSRDITATLRDMDLSVCAEYFSADTASSMATSEAHAIFNQHRVSSACLKPGTREFIGHAALAESLVCRVYDERRRTLAFVLWRETRGAPTPRRRLRSGRQL